MTSPAFKGKYRGMKYDDWDDVIKRARQFGVQKFLFSAISLEDGVKSLELSKGSNDFYSTIGVHPTRATEPYKLIG